MNPRLLLHLALFQSLASVANCQLVLPNLFCQSPSPSSPLAPPAQDNDAAQVPIMPVQPSASDSDSNNSPTLYDTLPLTRRINIFSTLLRDHPNLPSLLSSQPDPKTTNFTILAPLNSALQSLSHKPWEDDDQYAALGERAYEGESGRERANGNLKRFVEGHIVSVSPWRAGEKVKTMCGGSSQEVWWEKKQEEADDGKGEKKSKRVIMPGQVEVEEVVSRVANGEIWVLKGVLGPW